MVRKAHVSIVLDRSASMESCRSEAVQAVNAYLDELKGTGGVDIRVSLMLFDSQAIDAVRDRIAVAGCADLRPEEFRPRGKTPLLDAIGYSAGLLDCLSAKDERRVLAVLTDGLENASREYTREQIKGLLARKEREEGWQVHFLGAAYENWAGVADTGGSQRAAAGKPIRVRSRVAPAHSAAGVRRTGRLTLADPLRIVTGRPPILLPSRSGSH